MNLTPNFGKLYNTCEVYTFTHCIAFDYRTILYILFPHPRYILVCGFEMHCVTLYVYMPFIKYLSNTHFKNFNPQVHKIGKPGPGVEVSNLKGENCHGSSQCLEGIIELSVESTSFIVFFRITI